MTYMTKEKFKRILLSAVAAFLIALSIGILRYTDMGVGPFVLFNLGLGNMINQPFSLVYSSVNAIIFIVILFLNRKAVGRGTVFNIFLVGPLTDFFMDLFTRLYPSPSLAFRVVFTILGAVIMAIGVAIYAGADVGVSAYDSVFITLNKKRPNISLGRARMITDATSAIIGVIGRATIGIGTVVVVLTVGPMVEFFMKNLVPKLFAAFGLSL